MDSATDTESEADHAAAPMRMALSPSFVSPSVDTCSDLKDVHAALRELRIIETSLLRKVPRT